MRVFLVLVVIAGVAASRSQPSVRTLRVDYFHTGNETQELFSLDELVVEPTAWPGPPSQTEDPLRYGAYGFDVRDAASKRLLYSQGFGSIYDEWVTTEHHVHAHRLLLRRLQTRASRRDRHVHETLTGSHRRSGDQKKI